jgi:hypothetical protein
MGRSIMLDFLNKVVNNAFLHPQWRIGQTYFNTLNMEHPELSERVRGIIGLDPFYAEVPTDPRILAFLEWLEKELDD